MFDVTLAIGQLSALHKFIPHCVKGFCGRRRRDRICLTQFATTRYKKQFTFCSNYSRLVQRKFGPFPDRDFTSLKPPQEKIDFVCEPARFEKKISLLLAQQTRFCTYSFLKKKTCFCFLFRFRTRGILHSYDFRLFSKCEMPISLSSLIVIWQSKTFVVTFHCQRIRVVAVDSAPIAFDFQQVAVTHIVGL